MPAREIIGSATDLAHALKAQRKRLGLNQAEVADMHDLSRFTIVDVESGKGDPKLSTLLRLMEALGLRLVAVPTQLVDRIVLPEPEVQSLSADDLEIDFGEADWDLEEGAGS